MAKFPVSYSRLNTYDSCELKFDYLHVSKTVIDPGNTHTEYGNRVHMSLYKYAESGNEEFITAETVKFKPLVDRIQTKPGTKYFEYRMAIDEEENPCGWFDEKVWFRGVADVLVLQGRTAVCLDWKTGKVRDDPKQLSLFACLIFMHFPEVQEVTGSYIWLGHDQTSTHKFTRDQKNDLWRYFERLSGKLDDSVELGVFSPKPSPLCNWCPAKRVCAYAY